MAKSRKIGIDIPGSLKIDAIDRLSEVTGPKLGGPWNGVLYRWVSASEMDRMWRESVSANNSPEPNERWRQEDALFHFFVDATSCLECFYLGSYFLGAAVRPDFFPISSKTLRAYPTEVADAYARGWPETQFATLLRETLAATDCQFMKDMRDALAHRGTLPRLFHRGGELDGAAFVPGQPKAHPAEWEYQLPVHPELTTATLAWLEGVLNALAEAGLQMLDSKKV